MDVDPIVIYVIIIIGIIALIFVIVIPLIYTPVEYGSYKVVSDRCVPNGTHCADGGTRTIVQDCIPNPNNGQPCLHNGKITFDSIVTTEPCNVQCYSSKWVLTGTTCEGNNLMDLYTCQAHDPTGVNDCGMMDDVPYGGHYLRQYVIKRIGSTRTKLNKVDGCVSNMPEGKWVYVNAKGAIRSKDTINKYLLSKSCDAEYHLQEGTYKISPACLLDGGRVNLDGTGCDLTTKPAVLYEPCRKYLKPLKINNIIDKLTNSFITISINGKYLGLLEYDVGKTELVLGDKPIAFFLAPRGIINDKLNYQFKAVIACIPALAMDGWMILEQDKLFWAPASPGPGEPGLISDQATLFDITIVRDSLLTIKGTSIINAEIKLHPIETIESLFNPN